MSLEFSLVTDKFDNSLQLWHQDSLHGDNVDIELRDDGTFWLVEYVDGDINEVQKKQIGNLALFLRQLLIERLERDMKWYEQQSKLEKVNEE